MRGAQTFTTEDRLQLMDLRRRGYTFSEIEAVIGHPRHTCRDYFNRLPPDIKREIKAEFERIQQDRIVERNQRNGKRARLHKALDQIENEDFDEWGRCCIARMHDRSEAGDLIDEIFTMVHGDEKFEDVRLRR